MSIKIDRKISKSPLLLKQEGTIPYLAFPNLEKLGFVMHGFSTRLGGVSKGHLSSMNLGFSRGDDPEAVQENYQRITKAIGIKVESLVLSHQTHTTNIKTVSKKDCGKGILRPRGYTDIDGLVTNDPEVTLVTFYADCVPLLFVDPVKRVIASAHSGWRGTVSKIGREAVLKMQQEFGSCPKDIVAAIGPSICQDCYEVSEEVREAFLGEFPESVIETCFQNKENKKYQLDLWKANRFVLEEAGVNPANIAVTDICTCCNPELLYSHRASKGLRGNMAAFLCYRKPIT